MEQPENSLPAFINSLENGIKYLECDVHMTKDHQVVVAHDHNITRVHEIPENEERRFIC